MRQKSPASHPSIPWEFSFISKYLLTPISTVKATNSGHNVINPTGFLACQTKSPCLPFSHFRTLRTYGFASTCTHLYRANTVPATSAAVPYVLRCILLPVSAMFRRFHCLSPTPAKNFSPPPRPPISCTHALCRCVTARTCCTGTCSNTTHVQAVIFPAGVVVAAADSNAGVCSWFLSDPWSRIANRMQPLRNSESTLLTASRYRACLLLCGAAALSRGLLAIGFHVVVEFRVGVVPSLEVLEVVRLKHVSPPLCGRVDHFACDVDAPRVLHLRGGVSAQHSHLPEAPS